MASRGRSMHDAPLMLKLLVAAALLAACHGNDPANGGPGSASATTTPSNVPAAGSDVVAAPGSAGSAAPAGSGSAMVAQGSGSAAAPAAGSGSGSAAVAVAPPSTPEPALDGHDFTPDARAWMVVGACGDGDPPADFPKKLLESHCAEVKKAQTDYQENWVKPARAFFAEHVPKDIPKVVVYPFAGGDLSTALTVYPDADEITTMSLEPAGDPRSMGNVKGGDLERAMNKVAYELKFLYRVNFSNTLNMIDAMRSGAVPTEVMFGLSALKVHGYDLVSFRYFKVNDDGTLHYLDDADLAKAPDPKTSAERRNRVFANYELRFKKPGGRVQVYRHIQQNLDNEHLKSEPAVMAYLNARPQKIAAMTKAASYLLSYDGFSTIRDYLTSRVQWMVSDATGIAPKWGKPAGFEYETYGSFVGPHIPAGGGISKDWRTEFESEPARELPFRFGYYDKKNANHLIIIKKKA
jgi:hypothetical protein